MVARHLFTHALQDLSGVLEELPHIGPDRLLKLPGGYVWRVVEGGSASAQRVVVATLVVGVLLPPGRVGVADARTTTHLAGNETAQEVVSALLPTRVAPVLFELGQRTAPEFGLDNGRDRLLYDLSRR